MGTGLAAGSLDHLELHGAGSSKFVFVLGLPGICDDGGTLGRYGLWRLARPFLFLGAFVSPIYGLCAGISVDLCGMSAVESVFSGQADTYEGDANRPSASAVILAANISGTCAGPAGRLPGMAVESLDSTKILHKNVRKKQKYLLYGSLPLII